MTSQTVVYLVLALLAGACAALQPAANAGLKTHLGGLWPALLVNTLVLLVLVVGCAIASRQTRLDLAALRAVPLPLVLGGFFGFVMIAATAYVLPHLGAAQTLVVVTCGLGITAVAMDHFGAFGNPQVAISPMRLLGLACLVGGVFLMRHGTPR